MSSPDIIEQKSLDSLVNTIKYHTRSLEEDPGDKAALCERNEELLDKDTKYDSEKQSGPAMRNRHDLARNTRFV